MFKTIQSGEIRPETTTLGYRPCFSWNPPTNGGLAVTPDRFDKLLNGGKPLEGEFIAEDVPYPEQFWICMKLSKGMKYEEYRLGIQILCELGWGEVATDCLFNTYTYIGQNSARIKSSERR